MVVIKTSSVCDDPNKSDCQQLANFLSSKKIPELVTVLNVLLEATFDHEDNYALGENGNEVVLGLVRAFEFAIGYENNEKYTRNNKRIKPNDVKDENEKLEAIFSNAWTSNLDFEDDSQSNDDDEGKDEWHHWTKFCVNKLRADKIYSSPDAALSETSLKIIEVIALVVRNLSFVAANLRFLAHSIEMIRMLGVCLHFRTGKINTSTSSDTTSSASNNDSNQLCNDSICMYAIHTLINIAPFLDVSGKKLFTDKMLVQSNSQTNALLPPHGYSQVHSLGMGGVLLAKKIDCIYEESIPEHFQYYILELCKEHILAIVSLFPGIRSVFDCNNNQSLVVALLDLFKELVENSDLRPVLLNTPSDVLNHLVDLLWVPRLGPDSLDYIDPLNNLVSRVTSLKLASGYDATIDYDVRDRSLELLELFTSLSPQLKQGILQQNSPKIYNYILPICSSKVGRGDISQIAIRLLANLALVSSQDIDPSLLMYVESKIVMLSSSDPHIANIACNSVFNN